MERLELWCPHCGEQALVKNGEVRDLKKQRFMCRSCERNTVNPLHEMPAPKQGIQNRKLPKATRYVITSAQNATDVHESFFKSLLQYCKENDAELIVIPFRYKNPTSHWSEKAKKEDYWQVDEKYLYRTRGDLNSNLRLLGDIRTQPTASKPLTGLESISEHLSGIVGHPKLQLKCIPTPHHHLPKIMTTTGCCTEPNYTDTKAGKKGEFHHTLAALVVEVDGDVFHLRHINALKNGTFIDLWRKYTPEGSEAAPPAAALIMGDTHVRFIDKLVEGATFGSSRDSIIGSLAPQVLVWHDLLDLYSRNPHHRQNPFIEVAKRAAKFHLVEEEVQEAINFVRERTATDQKSVIVPSNHNDFLTRYILDTDWRRDPENASFYLKIANRMVEAARMTEHGASYPDPFSLYAKDYLDKRFIFPERDQSYTVRDIELNQHGDLGPNGAKGSIEGFRRIGVKSVVGHSHTPGIDEGCYQVGTSTNLRLEYNHGPSSWLNTHCVIYANGKRALLNIIDGAWRVD